MKTLGRKKNKYSANKRSSKRKIWSLGRNPGGRRRKRARPKRHRYEIAVPALGGAERMAYQLQTVPRLVSGLLLVIAGWLIYWFISADLFYIQHLQLDGNWRVPEAELLTISGLDGVNIFWADTKAAEMAISALPDVESARVRCSLPAKCFVQVKERPALLVWRQGDAQIWIGADGVALPARGELPNAMVLDAVESTALRPGDSVPPTLIATVQELERLQPDVRVYQYADQFGLSFRNDFGWLVRLGHDGDVAVKLNLVYTLANYLLTQDVTPTYIDVRYPKAPYYGE